MADRGIETDLTPAPIGKTLRETQETAISGIAFNYSATTLLVPETTTKIAEFPGMFLGRFAGALTDSSRARHYTLPHDQASDVRSIAEERLNSSLNIGGEFVVTGWSAERCHGLLTQYVESRMPRWVRRHLGVSDVVQSVLCVASRCKDQFRGTTDSEYRGWLIRIAERKVIDSLRRYQSRRCPPSKQPTAAVISPGKADHETPERRLSLIELARDLLESIESLPDDVQLVVMARYTRDLSFAQIASEIGIPETTCKRRWLEGIETLATQLDGHQI